MEGMRGRRISLIKRCARGYVVDQMIIWDGKNGAVELGFARCGGNVREEGKSLRFGWSRERVEVEGCCDTFV